MGGGDMTLISRGLRDELGPEGIASIREPRVGLEAVVAVRGTRKL